MQIHKFYLEFRKQLLVKEGAILIAMHNINIKSNIINYEYIYIYIYIYIYKIHKTYIHILYIYIYIYIYKINYYINSYIINNNTYKIIYKQKSE